MPTEEVGTFHHRVAEMVNELIEAKNNNELDRVTQRWTRYELIVIDELAVVAMPETVS